MIVILIYDFEVFKYDWLVVLSDIKNKDNTIIVNDTNLLRDFYEAHKYDIWVGFNNKNYDQYILKGILKGYNPYEISKFIIIDGKQGFDYAEDINSILLYSYDVFNTLKHGLKYYEGSMGDSIKESSVPFDIDRKLTVDEIEETKKYCLHDVLETTKILFERIDDFNAQLGLCKLSRPQYISKTQTQLASLILKADPISYTADEFQIDVPTNLKLNKYSFVKDWYLNFDNKSYDKQLEVDIAGVPHIFAWGGLHGATERMHFKGRILLMDVASLYPSLMINYNLLSRAVEKQEIYKDLRDKRINYKKAHNPLQLPLKLVLNKTYGAMKDKNNSLYDPRQANRVCIYGQLLILDLIEHIEPYCILLQTNTDGIMILLNDDVTYEDIKNIVTEWETRTGLTLEITKAMELWQKDVNNYILKINDKDIKSKGGYVKPYDILDNGDYPIVDKAIIDYFTKGISIEDTINNAKNLIDFQLIVKLTGKFINLYHGDKKLNEKCIRVFANLDKNAPTVYKEHIDTKKLHKVSNAPEHVFIFNDSVLNVDIPSNLDRKFYINLAKDRCSDFVTVGDDKTNDIVRKGWSEG